MKAQQNLLVELRVYRGEELSYDAFGNVKTENFKVHIQYPTLEWNRFLANLLPNGFLKPKIERVFDLSKLVEGKDKSEEDCYQELTDFSQLQEQVDKAMKAVDDVTLTADQQKIKDLEELVNSLVAKKEEAVNEDGGIDPKLIEARKAYFDFFGKKGSNRWTAEENYAKIEEERLK
jgi:hypothetical protein